MKNCFYCGHIFYERNANGEIEKEVQVTLSHNGMVVSFPVCSECATKLLPSCFKDVKWEKKPEKFCYWTFKSKECGYQGPDLTCTKTKSSCEGKGNLSRWPR